MGSNKWFNGIAFMFLSFLSFLGYTFDGLVHDHAVFSQSMTRPFFLEFQNGAKKNCSQLTRKFPPLVHLDADTVTKKYWTCGFTASNTSFGDLSFGAGRSRGQRRGLAAALASWLPRCPAK
jgi:hypothetical protein